MLDGARFTAHVRRLLGAGIDGVAPFGTTGEGQSFTIAERSAGLEILLAAGIDAARILPATGCAAVPDTVALTRHAVAAGCAGALVLPPFFFKNITAEGLYATYASLIDRVADARLRLYLYHIPQVSGVAIDMDVVARLIAAYPGTIAGIKDSAGDLAHSKALAARFPQLAIFVGHEPHLPAMLAAGGAGTICGIANLFPRLMRRMYDSAATSGNDEDLRRIERLLDQLRPYPIFAAMKATMANLTGDNAWGALRPPLVALDPARRTAMLDAIKAAGMDPQRDAAGGA
jgi:4-hydroxy-tetrahydrodipicolinate synthase